MSDTLLSPPSPAPALPPPRRPTTAGYWLGATVAVAWHAARRLIGPGGVLLAGVAIGVTVIVVTASRRSKPYGPSPSC